MNTRVKRMNTCIAFSLPIALLLTLLNLSHATQTSQEAVFTSRLQIARSADSLELSCVLIEGFFEEEDFGGPFNPNDVRSWICCSSIYARSADTLFLIADSTAIDNDFLGVIEGGPISRELEIIDYDLNACFARGITLPIRSVAKVGPYLVFKVFPISIMVSGYDYIIPQLRRSSARQSEEVMLAGFVIDEGLMTYPGQILSIDGPLTPGGMFSFGSTVLVNAPLLPGTYQGAPAFAKNPNGSWALMGICLPRASSNAFCAIRSLPTAPGWLDSIPRTDWFSPDPESIMQRVHELR